MMQVQQSSRLWEHKQVSSTYTPSHFNFMYTSQNYVQMTEYTNTFTAERLQFYQHVSASVSAYHT